MNQEQLNYVKEQLQKGLSKEQISTDLVAAGYNEATIAELLSAAERNADDVPPPVTSGSSLPSAMTFLSASWAVVKQRPDITMQTVFIFSIFALLIPLVPTVMAPGTASDLVVDAVTLLSAVVSTVLYIAILRVFFSEDSMSLADGLSFAGSRIFSYFWMTILVGAVTLAGLAVFLIPGIVLGIYLLLAPAVWMREDTRGISALVRSTQLIHGHWWAVFGRYALFTVSALALMVVVSFMIGLVATLIGIDPNSAWLEIIIAALSGLVLVASAGALFQIYSGLKDTKPAFVPEQASKLRTFYIVAAALAPFIIGIVLVLLLLPLLLTAAALGGV